MTDVDKIKEELAELKRKTLEKEKQIEEAMAASLHDLADKFSMMAREAGFTGATADFADILKGRKTKASTGKRASNYRYLDDEGVEHMRPPRATGKTWTEVKKKQYRQNYIDKHGK